MGRRVPPMLLTRKMKKTTVWTRYLRSRLVSSSGRMSSMLAPVVPMKLAIRVPTRMKLAFTVGVALRSPVIEIPPEIT
jgi:hypothetical protein